MSTGDIMTKKTATANKAIDFARLFAVKDQVARQAAEDNLTADVMARELEEQGRGESARRPFLVEAEKAPESATFDVPTDGPVVEPSAVAVFDSKAGAGARRSTSLPNRKTPLLAMEDAPNSSIRVGMTRELHSRVRACAALRGAAPTMFAREVLEESTPTFDAKAPLSELARKARSVVAVGKGGPRRADVRMQIPVTDDLHQRLIQLAALRTQTLGACLLDILEHHVPGM
jgi:hypothetical protein